MFKKMKVSFLIYHSKQQQSNIHFLYSYRNHVAIQFSVSVSQSHFQILFRYSKNTRFEKKSVVCVYGYKASCITVTKERVIRMGMESKASYSYDRK